MANVGQNIWAPPPPNPIISLPGPGRPEDTNKRRLLLIYVHGFQGDETTFQEFPKHLHGPVSDMLIESHVVYTRIYPRYKSQGELQTAVNHFSAWLAPHQADDLDVILLGHSIGGILSADVTLLQRGSRPKHRILGIIAFDTPFLGLHPRIISDGLKSIWPSKEHVSAEDKIADEQEALGMEPAYKPTVPMERVEAPDPNFNRPWRNDKRQPDRGFLGGMKHFVEKKRNEECFGRAVFNRFLSPVKFANCVNNYTELKQRYMAIKRMEHESNPYRIRFFNYYTSSEGRPKKPKKTGEKSDDKENQNENDKYNGNDNDNEKGESAPSTPPREGSLTPSLAESSQMSASMSSLSLAESSSLSESMSHSTGDSGNSNLKVPKPKKPQRFILLPSWHWKTDDDAGWGPVSMGQMDAVLAHQSMFTPKGRHYEHLLGDTISLIERWVQDDLTRRLVQEYS